MVVMLFFFTLFSIARSDLSDPFTYQSQLGVGLATDIFKNETNYGDYYDALMIEDFAERGITALRHRCRGDIFGYATDTYDDVSMQIFLTNLETVVDDTIANNISPVVAMVHNLIEERALPIDGDNFVDWWVRVAERLKHKSLKLSFNLFTEIGQGNLRDNPVQYNDWMRRAIEGIRGTGGNNTNRIIMLPSPGKTSFNLWDIDSTIFSEDSHLMVEWHYYASGPNQDPESPKCWNNNGLPEQRAVVKDHIAEAVAFGQQNNVPTWQGAWMPMPNKEKSLTNGEIEKFAIFHAKKLHLDGIPSCLNSVKHFYDVVSRSWIDKKRIPEIDGRNVFVCNALNKIMKLYDFPNWNWPECVSSP